MEDLSWFKKFLDSQEFKYLHDHPIVYFCAEYAIKESLPIYAGGLGVLAGDLIREASDQMIPLIVVGLYYHEGYLYHDLYNEGIMMKVFDRINPAAVGLSPVIDRQNNRIIVSVPIQDVYVDIQAWQLQIGSVTIYLLDTDLPQNSAEDRRITDQLYTPSKEGRFKQEIVLGLGGSRLLQVLHITPSGYHLNEGHSALLALEITRNEMIKNKTNFAEEIEKTKNHIFFSNHTLIPAGNDTFNTDLTATLLSGFARELQVPVDIITKLGLVSGSSIFSMTLLALRLAGKINAVSKLHAEKAKDIWPDHPMTPITNGIHIKTWDGIGDDEDLWNKHQTNKLNLLQYISSITGVKFYENTLLLGWARRIVSYKRPFALFEDLERFKKIASDSNRPVRVVISGLSHENDADGLRILERIEKIVKEDLKDIVVYLPNYRLATAKLLVAGCDVWLNTPVVGYEACGTSGMKAALNGVLPFSTPDGWVAEAELYEVGWVLDSARIADNILSVLENSILPLYYNRDKENIPVQWLKMMHNARDMVLNQFSAVKMLRRYFEEFYIPAIKSAIINSSK